MNLELTERKELTAVPSASGVVKTGKLFFIIGDNSPFLFKLNPDFSVLKKIPLVQHANLQNEIFLKKDKPDFEAITLWEKAEEKILLIFGSGSISPQRDVLVLVNLAKEDAPTCYSMTNFYAHLRKLDNIAPEDFNIEAATIAKDELLLFNRGNNMVFSFNAEAFFKTQKPEAEFPPIKIHHIKLPVMEGVQGGFSAANYIAETQQILFTATLENTSNWIDDGEVLGSYLGFLSLKNLANHPEPTLIPVTQNNLVQKIKVEGIAVNNIEKAAMEVTMVTDSDGGASEVLQGKIVH